MKRAKREAEHAYDDQDGAEPIIHTVVGTAAQAQPLIFTVNNWFGKPNDAGEYNQIPFSIL